MTETPVVEMTRFPSGRAVHDTGQLRPAIRKFPSRTPGPCRQDIGAAAQKEPDKHGRWRGHVEASVEGLSSRLDAPDDLCPGRRECPPPPRPFRWRRSRYHRRELR